MQELKKWSPYGNEHVAARKEHSLLKESCGVEVEVVNEFKYLGLLSLQIEGGGGSGGKHRLKG